MNLNLKDVVTNHPDHVALCALIIIPVCIWTLIIVRDMISGDMDVLFGIAGATSALVLGVVCWSPAFYDWTPVCVFLAYLSFLVVPACRYFFNQQELKDLEVEKIEKAYQTIGLRPENPVLKFRLAEMLVARGLIDGGVSISSAVLDRMPQRSYPEEHRHAAIWKGIATQPLPSSYACPQCGHRNNPKDVFCQSCGAPYYLLMVKGNTVSINLNNRFMGIWLCLILGGIGVPATLSIANPLITIPVSILLVLVCVVVLVKSFAGPSEVAD